MFSKTVVAMAVSSALMCGVASAAIEYVPTELPFEEFSAYINDSGEIAGTIKVREVVAGNYVDVSHAAIRTNSGELIDLTPTTYPAGSIPACPHDSGQVVYSYVLGINNNRWVIGYCDTIYHYDTKELVAWKPDGSYVKFSPISSTYNIPILINNSNQILYTKLDNEGQPYISLYSESGVINFSRGKTSRLLSDSGSVVFNNAYQYGVYFWKAGNLPDISEEISVPGLTNLIITGINNSDWIIGYGTNPQGYIQSFIRNPANGETLILGNLGVDNTWAYDINNLGHVVGCSYYAIGRAHPFIWHGGVMTDISVISDDGCSSAKINNNGQVAWAGAIPGGRYMSYVYVYELGNSVPLSDQGVGILDINNQGKVLGTLGGKIVQWSPVNIPDPNTPPSPNAGLDQTITLSQVSSTILAGTVSDPDDTLLNYRWLYGSNVLSAGNTQPGKTIYLPLTAVYPVGQHTFRFEVSDGKDTRSDDVVITVIADPPPVDTIPPRLLIWTDQKRLLTNNGTLQTRTIKTLATDNSGVRPTITAIVSSSQPASGLGPKDQFPDWTTPVINSDGSITLSLRGEVLRLALQRNYTIMVTATDKAGNSISKDLTFYVVR